MEWRIHLSTELCKPKPKCSFIYETRSAVWDQKWRLSGIRLVTLAWLFPSSKRTNYLQYYLPGKQNRGDKHIAPRHQQWQLSWKELLFGIIRQYKKAYACVCVDICIFLSELISGFCLLQNNLQWNRKHTGAWFDSSFWRLPGLSSCRAW